MRNSIALDYRLHAPQATGGRGRLYGLYIAVLDVVVVLLLLLTMLMGAVVAVVIQLVVVVRLQLCDCNCAIAIGFVVLFICTYIFCRSHSKY